MFRLLPWSSAIGGNKVMAEDFKMLAASHCCDARPQLKRKRSESDESTARIDAPLTAKPRPDNAENSATANDAQLPSQVPLTPTATDPAVPTPTDQAATPHKMDVDKLRETIEAQLSLEILLKHNELRLIDQEIAKCQVALEQLRRCAEIPYPGSSVAGLSHSVSSGSGAAVSTPGNGPLPRSPAPWGVTDGPYTTHYAKWLLPDPRFDGGEAEASPFQPQVEGRATRGNPWGDGGYMTGKFRSQRGSASAKLQALPSGYPPPKEKAGPMIIRRKSDGVLVKLVCLDCRRDNFSSTQGFINHCRIAHNRNFASHDAAAMASGEPVDANDPGAATVGKSETPSKTTTPGYVHPLVRSAHAIESTSRTHETASTTPRKRSKTSRPSVVETPTPVAGRSREAKHRVSSHGPVTPNPSFSASSDTPHLSSLMQRKGVGVDLGGLVDEAKTTVDIDVPSYGEDEDQSDPEPSQPPNNDLSSHGRQPMRTTAPQDSLHRHCSQKGVDRAHPKPHPLKASPSAQSAPYTSPYGPAVPSSKPPQADELRDVDAADNSANLSPNTVESNQAPSLVSDDDDDGEAASDSESPSPDSSEAEDEDQDFSHIEVEGDEVTTTDPKREPDLTGATTHHAASLSKPLKGKSSTKKERLVSPSIVRLSRGKDAKRVSFANSKNSPAKGKKESNRRQNQG